MVAIIGNFVPGIALCVFFGNSVAMSILSRKTLVAVLMASAVAGVCLAEGFFRPVVACNYYASPSGGGNGSSKSSPFKIADFWKVAAPGKMLCLLDGVYTDYRSNIAPPSNLNGKSSAIITIRALNDGKVRISGSGVRNAVRLYYNDYFVLEGFDAYNSGGVAASVIRVGTSADHNVFRRICAWDAPANGNEGIWGFNHNTGNLLEDVCGFGSGRKIFSSSYYGSNLTIRRAWGRWEKSSYIGPKMTFSLVYQSTGNTFENVIGTWNESAMGSTAVNQPFGILSMDSTASNACANSRYLGSIGYIRGGDKVRSLSGLARSSNDTECLTFKDVVAYIEPGKHLTIKPFSLLNDPGTSTQKYAINITEIGGGASTISSQWQVSNDIDLLRVSTSSSIWTGSGARVCKRYVNGSLTSQPLWPWPMNQRIINAMNAAGKTPVDVTKTMEQIFGPIPSSCRSTSTLTAPGNLIIQ
jgi:hypothetical protein